MTQHNSEGPTATGGCDTQERKELLSRYLRRTACSAAAGLGAMGAATDNADAAVIVGDPTPDLNRLFYYTGWATQGLSGAYPYSAFGIDLDYNGYGDVNFFRGAGGSNGYLVARTDTVGYAYGNVYGSGQVQLLTNSTANPDVAGYQVGPPNVDLQGFNAGEVIGDGDDPVGAVAGQNIMDGAYQYFDWDGVPDDGVTPSYIGFQIGGLSSGSGSGFGWIEVLVDNGAGFNPKLVITRWAYTDDDTPLAAGEIPEPSSLALLAAGAGALAYRKKKVSR